MGSLKLLTATKLHHSEPQPIKESIRTLVRVCFTEELAIGGEDEADIERTACACLRDLLSAMRPEYSQVLQLADLDGQPAEAVAAQVGISRNNLKVRLHRARRQLRQRLEQTCQLCAKTRLSRLPVRTDSEELNMKTDSTHNDHAAHSCCGGNSDAETARTGAAKPYPLDVCLVSDERLGAHGEPHVFVHEGREIKLCCAGCLNAFHKDPAKFIAKLDRAVTERGGGHAAHAGSHSAAQTTGAAAAR